MTNHDSIKVNGRTRIPDYLNVDGKVMGEAKSVHYLTRSQQLEDMFAYANQNGYKMFLKVERWTKLSGPMKNLIKQYGVFVDVF